MHEEVDNFFLKIDFRQLKVDIKSWCFILSLFFTQIESRSCNTQMSCLKGRVNSSANHKNVFCKETGKMWHIQSCNHFPQRLTINRILLIVFHQKISKAKAVIFYSFLHVTTLHVNVFLQNLECTFFTYFSFDTNSFHFLHYSLFYEANSIYSVRCIF